MEGQVIFDVIGAGGNAALVAIAWAIWRLERRVLVLEQKLEGMRHEVVA